jgi:hypothetical protein
MDITAEDLVKLLSKPAGPSIEAQAEDVTEGLVKLLRSGIYILLQNLEIVYIGQSKCVLTRLSTHINEKNKKFNGIRMIVEPDEKERLAVEQLLIAKYQPIYNGQPVWSGNRKPTKTARTSCLIDSDFDED